MVFHWKRTLVLQTALNQNNFSKITISDKINENEVDEEELKEKSDNWCVRFEK